MPSVPPTHKPAWASSSTRHQRYDREQRDPRSKQFYDSSQWRQTRALKLARNPLCEGCQRAGKLTAASHVHHIVELKTDWDRRLDPSNLESLCHSCHSRLHAAPRGG